MLTRILFFALCVVFLAAPAFGEPKVSSDTAECLACHANSTPGVVADWQRSRHAQVTPDEALKKPALGRRISVTKAPDKLNATVVGCAECHVSNSKKHKDAFDHNGAQVHVVVTPEDCAVCHPTEMNQYGKNLMSHAHINLARNPLYQDLVKSINGVPTFKDMKVSVEAPDAETNAESCYHCHGTVIEVTGTVTRQTKDGDMEFPVLSGWPNQGVGRINPDGSLGSCTSCHARHQFSITMARKPYTCSQCHKGPDVPAYAVYQVSKHGNLFSSVGSEWNMSAVPWTVGKDFTAPTCAACHVSLLTNASQETIVERTHQMNDRNSWRLVGLGYAHAHPKSPDTSIIRNKAGLSLPTELTGEPAGTYLISPAEQFARLRVMKKVCNSCHSRGWVDKHFDRLDNTVDKTNKSTLAATQILLTAWDRGAAKGPAQGDSMFNEAIEKKWVEQWMFYANSTRFASAMAGADYGVFQRGRWDMAKDIEEMVDWLKFKLNDKSNHETLDKQTGTK
ncbi:MAG: hydroxylamine oxidase [Deltaproteobacteria bacterium]|nr:hydroxylamine oxidase [Deltaproteobacteria bacterium]